MQLGIRCAESGVGGPNEAVVPRVLADFVADVVQTVKILGVADVHFVGVDADDRPCPIDPFSN